MARKTSRKAASTALPLAITGTALLAAGGLLFGLWRRFAAQGTVEYLAPDLGLDQPRPGTNGRAPEAFRPDPTAPVPAAEREALRPATMPAPTLAEQRDVVEMSWPDEVSVAPPRMH
ncbi:MAG TPA: hypothetical protein VK980_04420 [Sphingomonas sp.]|jgi:hypothetical protein|nr:hypothetical protein [Sphingomonas sp.]